MKIRELIPEDIPSLARLFGGLESADWAKAMPSHEIEAELSRRHQLVGVHSVILVAEMHDGEVSGYGSVHWIPNLILPGMEGYVSELFVSPEHRGKGIGDSILAEIERLAAQKGCHRLSLLNMKDKESYKRGFYLKRKWVERSNAANMVKRIG